MAKALRKVVIDRKEWARGKPEHDRYLTGNEDGHCCLGFDAIACKVRSNVSNGGYFPMDLDGSIPLTTFNRLTEWGVEVDENIASTELKRFVRYNGGRGLQYVAANINDKKMDESKRERLLVEVFKLAGRELTFIN